MMNNLDWVRELPFAVTVCDRDGIVLYMNEFSVRTFEKSGGTSLIGTNLLACHPEPSKTKLIKMLESGEKNAYTIEKNGIKKVIYQCPWFEKGQYQGFVEMSLPVPLEMPHFVRK